jgi:hypothetical protein
MNTKLYIGLLASSLLAVAALQGCGSDTTTTTSTSSGTGGSSEATTSASGTGGAASTTSSSSASGTGGGMTTPAPPKLGTQIDRFGRPAINTALNHAFDPVDATKGAAKDAYNQQSDPTTWTTNAKEFAGNLAILDSLDTKCGNQLLAGPMPVAGRYDTLAGALANDRVYVNTAGTMCSTYLAVEANATGILMNTDCGGRKLDYDVIDTSYSALAAGAFSGVGDGVAADADTKGTMFPYLAAPH